MTTKILWLTVNEIACIASCYMIFSGMLICEGKYQI
jgi:hypothetical protein